MSELLQILSANIRTNDFTLEMMFYCGFVVDCLVFPSLLTTDTAKHYLEGEATRNPTNHVHHFPTPIIVVKT